MAVLVLLVVPGTPRERRVAAVPIGLVVAAVVVLQLSLPRVERDWSQGMVYGVNGLERVALGLTWLGKAARLCIAPTGLVPAHGYAEVDPSLNTLAPHALVGAVALVALGCGWVVALRRGASAVVVLGVVGLGPLVLVSSLLVRTPTDLPERLLYGASFAVSGLVAIALARGMADPARRTLAIGLLALAMFGAGAVAQRPWVSSRALFDYAVETAPMVMNHRAFRAVTASRAGQPDVAAYELGVAAYLFNQYPRPVPPERLRDYEAHHAPNDWRALPADLFGGNPCVSVFGLLSAARAKVPAIERHMLAGFTDRYPRCFVRR
jgi:hypothetical protein